MPKHSGTIASLSLGLASIGGALMIYGAHWMISYPQDNASGMLVAFAALVPMFGSVCLLRCLR